MSTMDKSERTKLSKKLSYVCRHGAKELGLEIQSNGYINIQHLLKSPGYRGTSLPKIQEVVRTCEKQRFELKEEGGVWFIRASQGHTIASINDEELLTPIDENDRIDHCIHGTYLENVASIRENGLNKMKRNHIHFSEAMPGENGVISGMRGSCTAIVVVNMKAAIRDGIKFYRSANNVILSAGVGETGIIPPQYFVEITTRDKSSTLMKSNPSSSSTSTPPSTCTSTKSRVQHLPQQPDEDRKLSSETTTISDSFSPVPPPAGPPSALTWKQRLQATSSPQNTLHNTLPSSPSTIHRLKTLSIDYYCVIDFEATCLQNMKIIPQEIIEFPAILINAHTLQTVESELGAGQGVFHSYVKPIQHPILSSFCTELTGIEQSTVDKAPIFSHVYEQFLRFLQPFTRSPLVSTQSNDPLPSQAYTATHYSNIIFVSHGNFDFQTALCHQCHLSSVKTIVKSWINVKDIYLNLEKTSEQDYVNGRRPETGGGGGTGGGTGPGGGRKKKMSKIRNKGLGMAAMLENLNLQLIGRHHSGIDDTRNISRIFIELACRGGDLTLYTTLSR